MSRSWPVLILLWRAATTTAQEIPSAPVPEAPEALFETMIGSSEVELFLDGSWRASVSGAAGFLLRSGEGIQPLDLFPELPLGFDFAQQPELTFSVWLRKHYFVEFTVLGGFDENAFRAGYEGEGTLRSLVIGNRDIAIDPYPYLTVPETGDSSLGAEATLVSGDSRHELLVRYDNNSSGRKVFVGKNEVEEQRIPLPEYEQGVRMRLPDSGVSSLVVYLEDPEGSLPASDGRRYRSASPSDATADAETGIVTLKAKPAGRVVVYYTKGGFAVGDAMLGTAAIATVSAAGAVDPDMARDFDFAMGALWPGGPSASSLQVSIEGHNALLMREPGVFSLFDIQGSYAVGAALPAELWRLNARVVERGGYEARGTQPAAVLRVDPELSRVVATLAEDLRDLRNLYPLLAEDPTSARLYGPYRDDSEGLFDREILLETLSPVTSYVLEPDILSGSVSVTRNGSPETRFTVDNKTGQVTFLVPIGPTDRLEITYKKKGALLANGDLVLAWGNRFSLREPFVAELAAGFRWNALPGAYSEKPFTRTGVVLLSGGVSGELDNFDLDVEGAVSYAHPDTTGRLRLAGMEASGLDVALDEDLALPASPPDPSGSARQDNRGKLLYKDYRDYGLLGSYTLRGPDWSIPSSQVYAYETGSKPGPYNVAAASSTDTDESLVLDFDLQDGQWAGFQIPVLPGQPLPDLSSLEALIASYRMLDLNGEVNVSVEIGDVAEDVDGDGVLDAESSASATGFLFNDSGNGVALLVGGGPKGEGNERKDTEDLDGDEYLQTADGSFVASSPETALASATAWKVSRDTFDANDRQNLRRARAIRVFVQESTVGAAAATGRLLIDRVLLAGSTFAVADSTDGTLAVREVNERFAKSPPAKTLEETFDVVKDVFHAGGEVQKVLEIEWNGSGGADVWTVRGFTSTGTEGARYREVVHYLRVPTVPGTPTLTFELLDSDGKGVRWWYTPTAFSDWREVRVDIDKRRLTLNGTVPTGAAVTVDSHGSLVQLRVRLSGSDGSAGLVYLDEVHMASPIGSVGAAVAVDTELRVPGPLLRIGGVPIISDLRVRETARTVTPGFSPLYGRPAPGWGGSSRTEVGMSLPASQLDVHFVVDWTEAEATLGGGHGLQASAGPVTVADTFDLRSPGRDATFDRETRLRLSPAPGTALDASVRATGGDERLAQGWSGSVSAGAGRFHGSLVTALGLSTLQYRHVEDGYFDSWILGYRHYEPVEAPLLERTSSATAELGRDPDPVGFTLRLTPSTKSLPSAAGREQRNSFTARLASPVALDDRGTLLTAAYQRVLEISATESGPGQFSDDWSVLARDLAEQSYLYSSVPFQELWASDEAFRLASQDVTSAAYRPEVQLELSRRPGSRISHLFVPTRMLATAGRSLEKEGALYASLNLYSLTYQANAINLFGRLGAYPTFDFYDLDEIANSVALSLAYDQGGALDRGDLRWDTLLGLESGGGNQFTLSNRFSLAGADFDETQNTSQVSYTWFVRPGGGVRLPLLGPDITRDAFWVHDEALELTATSGDRPVTALVRHRSEIRIPEHGHVAATLAIGADYETFRAVSGSGESQREWVLRLVVQAGIEALIRFGSGEPKREGTPAAREATEGRPP